MKTQIKKRTPRRSKTMIPSKISTKLLREKASSIFTEKAHPKMTERYKFINTNEILKHLISLGFVPYDANQTNYRDEHNDNNGFQYHCIYLYHPNMVILNSVEPKIEDLFELIITNSYNGTSKCVIYCTLYNVHSNADTLCLSDGYSETIHIIDDILDENFFNKITNHFLEIVRIVKKMKSTILDESTKDEIALKIAGLRFKIDDLPFDYKQLLNQSNVDDKEKNDLWSIYLRLHDKMIKGYLFTATEKKVSRKIRSINNFQMNMDINKKIFKEIISHIK